MRQSTWTRSWLGCLGSLVVVGILVLSAGCGQDDRIEKQTVEKPASGGADGQLPKGHPAIGTTPPVGTASGQGGAGAATEQRLLAAIIPRGRQYWFFKATGPAEALAPHADGFIALVESIKFTEDAAAPPTWDLPEGWKQEPGSGMRLATIKLDPSDPTLEISVIPLPLIGDDADTYVLSNVNRWRAQVGMPAITVEQLADETTSIELEGTAAVIVDVTGKAASDGMHPMGMGPVGMGGGSGGFHGN